MTSSGVTKRDFLTAIFGWMLPRIRTPIQNAKHGAGPPLRRSPRNLLRRNTPGKYVICPSAIRTALMATWLVLLNVLLQTCSGVGARRGLPTPCSY